MGLDLVDVSDDAADIFFLTVGLDSSPPVVLSCGAEENHVLGSLLPHKLRARERAKKGNENFLFFFYLCRYCGKTRKRSRAEKCYVEINQRQLQRN